MDVLGVVTKRLRTVEGSFCSKMSLLTPHLIDCSVASRVVVMVQWLAYPTSIQGDAGSIPTHGTCFFFH